MLYLTEGGQETELMYKHGHELPEFAMYPRGGCCGTWDDHLRAVAEQLRPLQSAA